jgi:hypothetical protein
MSSRSGGTAVHSLTTRRASACSRPPSALTTKTVVRAADPGPPAVYVHHVSLTARTAEHHAVRPRIDAVHTLDEIPWLYRSHGVDPFTARLVLKVPRDGRRRSGEATTDRYERLLVLQDDALEVLTRDGSGFTTLRIPYALIVAVRDRVDLHDGLLTLHTSDGTTIPIPFSASSSEVVGDLTDLLVRLASAAAGHAYAAPRGEHVTPHVDLGTEEAGLATAFWDLVARDPELGYLSSHPRLPLRPSAAGVTGVVRRVRPMSLSGTIAACSPREVVILTRREQVLRRRAASSSVDRLHVLRHAITSTTSEPHPLWVGMSTLTMRAGAAVFPILVATTTALGCELLTVGG